MMFCAKNPITDKKNASGPCLVLLHPFFNSCMGICFVSQNDQKLWALDLSLHYSDSLAMFQLMSYVSNGQLDLKTHTFNVPPNKQVQKKRRRRVAGQDDEMPPNTSRDAVMSTRLLHTNLAVVHYSVFFQMCRAHGIGYDIKVRTMIHFIGHVVKGRPYFLGKINSYSAQSWTAQVSFSDWKIL